MNDALHHQTPDGNVELQRQWKKLLKTKIKEAQDQAVPMCLEEPHNPYKKDASYVFAAGRREIHELVYAMWAVKK